MKQITAVGLTDKFRPPATKVCRLCKIEKPIKEFSMQIKNSDGRTHECRTCKKEHEDRKKEQRKEHAKTFFDAKFFTLLFFLFSAIRAICLVTLSPNGIAHARMGFVVIAQGKRPVYLDCRKQALKWPMVGWDWREVGGTEK